MTVTYKNTSDKTLRIDGVQSTAGVFIVDYPKEIGAEKTGDIAVILEAETGAQSEIEVIRLKTSEGIKVLKIRLDREKVITLAQPTLTWAVGEKAAAKSTVLTLDKGVTVKAVKAFRGHEATVEAAGSGSYRIVVTPKSTAKAETFPVVVTLEPEVPGQIPLITCTIGAD